jgi:hypothetical protein
MSCSRRGTQVVRERSAKPLCVGSIPTRASNHFNDLHANQNFFATGLPGEFVVTFSRFPTESPFLGFPAEQPLQSAVELELLHFLHRFRLVLLLRMVTQPRS